MQFGDFWSVAIRLAIRSVLGRADLAAGILLAVLSFVLRTVPNRDSMMAELAWSVPLAIAILLIVVRLLLAPYWVYKEAESEAEKLNQRVQTLEDFTPKLAFGAPYEGLREFRDRTTTHSAGGIINTNIQRSISASGPHIDDLYGPISLGTGETERPHESSFAYVPVTNQNRNRGADAVDAIIRLDFFDDSTRIEILSRVPGRWADNPLVDPTPGEPRDHVARRNLRPNGETSAIDIATKEDDGADDDFWYAVDDNAQFFHHWKNPAHVLRAERVRVRITITAAGMREPFSDEFILQNKRRSDTPRISRASRARTTSWSRRSEAGRLETTFTERPPEKRNLRRWPFPRLSSSRIHK